MLKNKLLAIPKVFIISLFLSVIVGTSAMAQGVSISPGCALLNDLDPNNNYFLITATRIGSILNFYAGDQIFVTAGPPIPNGTPTTMSLEVGGVTVSANYPNTLNTTVLSYGNQSIALYIDSGFGANTPNATWSTSCIPSPLGPPTTNVVDIVINPCPVFSDGRINDCDTFNPVVLYGEEDASGQAGLHIYNPEGELLLSLDADTMGEDDCPTENTLLHYDAVNQIYIYQLSSCQYYLRAPMNEAGKWYIIIFDALTNSIYESWTEFIGS